MEDYVNFKKSELKEWAESNPIIETLINIEEKWRTVELVKIILTKNPLDILRIVDPPQELIEFAVSQNKNLLKFLTQRDLNFIGNKYIKDYDEYDDFQIDIPYYCKINIENNNKK